MAKKSKNTSKKQSDFREFVRLFADGKKSVRRAYSLYVIACVWLLVAVANFLLGYSEVGALFSGLGVLTLLFAAYADWKESRKK